jgi:hypothetical protein
MADDLERLGGRLPLFKPDALTAEQRRLYDDMTGRCKRSWSVIRGDRSPERGPGE